MTTIILYAVIDKASEMAARALKRAVTLFLRHLKWTDEAWVKDPEDIPVAVFGHDTVIYTGHGEPDGFILASDRKFKDPVVFRDKVVIALACYTAGKFGADVVRNGARAYVGFDDEFMFVMPRECLKKSCDPMKMEEVKVFFMPWLNLIELLLDGWNVETAVNAVKELYETYAEQLLRKHDKTALAVSGLLMHNARHLTLLGDGEARIA